MLIDAHCHFFTSSMLEQELVKFVGGFNDTAISFLQRSINSGRLDNVVGFFKIVMDKSAIDLYEYMYENYGEDFIAVPLMLDLTYAMENAYLKTDNNVENINKLKKELLKKSINKNDSFIQWTKDKISILEENIKSYTSKRNTNFFKDNYEAQLKELIAIKESMPDKIYPFFSIDPRRDKQFENGVLGEIQKYVGKDKPFIGLKLYTSLGYSPTNPVLYDNGDKQSVYSWCEKNQIPITVHCNNEGFSHKLSENYVEGDVYYSDYGEIISMDNLDEKNILRYKNNNIRNFESLVKERQLLLNHPKLWAKVLAKYPKLKINFAHLGGSQQIKEYTSGSKKAFWTKMIIDLVEKYPNAYTDLSCFKVSEQENFSIKEFYQKVYLNLPKKVQDKIMYGSDFYMLALYQPDLKEYIGDFKSVFGEDFKRISEDNPAVFLGLKKKSFFSSIFN